MWTVPEAARRLGLTERFVRGLASSGKLIGVEYHEGHWLIPESALEYYRQTCLGKPGRKKGVKTSSVRRVVELRLQRLGEVNAKELAAVLEVTQSTITTYLRELGAVFNPRTRTWKPKSKIASSHESSKSASVGSG